MDVLRVDLLFQIAGIGIFISVLNIVLKQAGKEEQAQMLTLVGVVIVLILVLQLWEILPTSAIFSISEPLKSRCSLYGNSQVVGFGVIAA